MSSRLSQTLESLHEMQSVNLQGAGIGVDCVLSLANALKENTTVTKITLTYTNNGINDEGAAALADALKVNKS
jgi:hypothetical protein